MQSTLRYIVGSAGCAAIRQSHANLDDAPDGLITQHADYAFAYYDASIYQSPTATPLYLAARHLVCSSQTIGIAAAGRIGMTAGTHWVTAGVEVAWPNGWGVGRNVWTHSYCDGEYNSVMNSGGQVLWAWKGGHSAYYYYDENYLPTTIAYDTTISFAQDHTLETDGSGTFATLVYNAAGYCTSRTTRWGEGGDVIQTATWDYAAVPGNSFVQRPKEVTVNGITTHYDISSWNGTLPGTVLTTYPNCSGQNGAGSTDSRETTQYDQFGRVHVATDAYGHSTTTNYNPISGAVSLVSSQTGTETLTTHVTQADSLGRPLAMVDAGGVVTTYSYADSLAQSVVMIETPGMAMTMITTDRQHGIRDTGTYDGDNHMLSLTREHYSATGALVAVDRYVAFNGANIGVGDCGQQIIGDVPPGGSGAYFYRTEYAYDSRGNVTWKRDEDGRQTRFTYDANNRLINTWDLKDGATWQLAQENAYDENWSGSTGSHYKGKLTSTRTYNGSGDDSSTDLTKFYYDRNGYLRGTATTRTAGADSSDISIMVDDRDNRGLCIATATYSSQPNWATVVTTADYAASTTENQFAGRLTLERTFYDPRGQVYRQQQYAINGSGGIDSGVQPLQTDYWHDGNGRTVKSQSAGDGWFSKTLYDGVGNVIEEARCIGSAASSSLTSLAGDNVLSLTAYTYDHGKLEDTRVGTSESNLVTVAMRQYDSNGLLDLVKAMNVNLSAAPDAGDWLTNDYTLGPGGEVKQATFAGSYLTQYAYDALLRELSASATGGGTSVLTTTSYSAAGVSGSATKVGTGAAATARYRSDADHRVASTMRPDGSYQKTVYRTDGLAEGTYIIAGEGSDPNSTDDDFVLSQTLYHYDSRRRLIWQATYERNGNAGSTPGALTGANARVSYQAYWHDNQDRVTYAADYGAAGAFSYSPTPPASSGTVLVTHTEYDGLGRAWRVTDPAGIVTQTDYNAAGLVERTTVNADGTGTQRQVTAYTYTGWGAIQTQTAVDPKGDGNGEGNTDDDQVTRYVYNDYCDPDVCPLPRKDLLVEVIYPSTPQHPTGGRVSYTYYADGSTKTMTDQRGVVHAYTYDVLGNLASDSITSLGTSGLVDGAIRRIGYEYDGQKRVTLVTSYSSPAGESGSIVNQVKLEYDDGVGGGSLSASYQSHSGAVVVESTAKVGYAYKSFGAGAVRLAGLTYPNGREVEYFLGTGQADTRLGRVGAISSNGQLIASYGYYGVAGLARQGVNTAAGALTLDYDPADNGTYSGLDRFGRITAQAWKNAAGTTVDAFNYTYDESSNVLTRDVAGPGAPGLDEAYTYDALNRLTSVNRGTLSWPGGQATITSPSGGSTWTLDGLGNWSGYQQDLNGDGDYADAGETDQIRATNAANEITGIANTPANATMPAWVAPAYDAAGNMILAPAPSAPTDAAAAQLYVYDAWNRMAKVYRDVDSTGTKTESDLLVAQYYYDGQGRRIAEAVALYGDSENPTTVTGYDRTDYYYDESGQVLEERSAAGVSPDDVAVPVGLPSGLPLSGPPVPGIPVSGPSVLQYVYGVGYAAAPIVRDTDLNGDGLCDGGNDQHLYYTSDANHNITALFDGTILSATSGQIVERYSYDSYGQWKIYAGDWSLQHVPDSPGLDGLLGTEDDIASPPDGTTSLYANEKGFTGLAYNRATGLWQAVNRDLHPLLGTWTQRDPAEVGLNLYEYCSSSPTDRNDPSGLADISYTDDPEPDRKMIYSHVFKGSTPWYAWLIGFRKKAEFEVAEKTDLCGGGWLVRTGGLCWRDPQDTTAVNICKYDVIVKDRNELKKILTSGGAPALYSSEEAKIYLLSQIQHLRATVVDLSGNATMIGPESWAEHGNAPMDLLEIYNRALVTVAPSILSNAASEAVSLWTEGMFWVYSAQYQALKVTCQVGSFESVREAQALGTAKARSSIAEAMVAVTNNHHPLPMFLGGNWKQTLTRLDVRLHGEFHEALRASLKKAGIPLPVGGIRGTAVEWARYMRLNPGSQIKAFDAVLNASRHIDTKYGTSITQDVWMSIMNGEFEAYP